MEPEVRFCTSADGTRIACATYGDKADKPFMIVWGWSTNFEVSWETAEFRLLFEGLGEGRFLVWFDRRGAGASQREVSDLSLEAHVADLEAVADGLRLGKFDLMGGTDGGTVACAYAARNPERISRLVLWAPYPRGAEIIPPEAAEGLIKLIHGNWSLARRAIADVVYPNGPTSQQQRFSDFLRRTASPSVAARYIEFLASVDVAPILPQIQASTLILHRRGTRDVPIRAGRAVAALIPDARIIALDGDTSDAAWGDTSYLVSVSEFLDEDAARQGVAEKPQVSGLATILFTDMESSTALTQRLGDAKAQELVREHNAIVREALKNHGGSEIKHTGDGIMASFPSASGALECAVAIQRAVAERSAVSDQPSAVSDQLSGLRVRIGLNAGEPVAEERDLFGTAVQLASRICDRAEGGEILASDVVRQLVAGKGFLFADRGATALRGFEDPVRLFEVRWREEG